MVPLILIPNTTGWTQSCTSPPTTCASATLWTNNALNKIMRLVATCFNVILCNLHASASSPWFPKKGCEVHTLWSVFSPLVVEFPLNVKQTLTCSNTSFHLLLLEFWYLWTKMAATQSRFPSTAPVWNTPSPAWRMAPGCCWCVTLRWDVAGRSTGRTSCWSRLPTDTTACAESAALQTLPLSLRYSRTVWAFTCTWINRQKKTLTAHKLNYCSLLNI